MLIEVVSYLESVWVRMKCGPTDVIIGVYSPPDMSTFFSIEFCGMLSEVTVRFPNSGLLLLGDLNFAAISWSSLTATANDPEAQACVFFLLQQHISEPTHCSANVRDLILTSKRLLQYYPLRRPF